MSFSVADAIRSRGLPVIIASGYGSQACPIRTEIGPFCKNLSKSTYCGR